MDTDGCNGQSFASANSIKVESYSDEEQGRFTEEERGERAEEAAVETGSVFRELSHTDTTTGAIRLPNGKLKCDICGMICIGPNVLMVHKRSHTGERPFQCTQCGASFTQKGNLLRHIKLHSGEKPFKCPFCSYACRRRDALTGHLRTHKVSSPSVGKPHKCSYCGRSYKQQSALEEHHERCHSYYHSTETQPLCTGDDVKDVDLVPDSLVQPSSDKMAFIDRLANSITKRKRSTPQKFLGQKQIRLNFPDAPYELRAQDTEGELTVEAPPFTSVGGAEFRPQHSSNHHLSELRPSLSTAPLSLGPRLDCTGVGAGREAAEGHEDLSAVRSRATSPSNGCNGGNGCQDSTDTESVQEEPITHHLKHNHHQNHFQHGSGPLQLLRAKEEERSDGGMVTPAPSSPPAPSSTSSSSSLQLRVVDSEGRVLRSFRCDHCRLLFLDHVMFTLHMGCHGFRMPFECNICGHRSRDRYEFSSHMVRGEHASDS
uniref:C2H2-type domain-containing protein n=1 Tax=Knipowitschia caucasica TaxID=637954 RepID=A0AAV2M6I7_KNICA